MKKKKWKQKLKNSHDDNINEDIIVSLKNIEFMYFFYINI